jgi:hypothetical protein
MVPLAAMNWLLALSPAVFTVTVIGIRFSVGFLLSLPQLTIKSIRAKNGIVYLVFIVIIKLWLKILDMLVHSYIQKWFGNIPSVFEQIVILPLEGPMFFPNLP